MAEKATYKDAGVDLELYQQSMARLPSLMHRTFDPRVIRQDGGFAGMFQLDFPSQLFARNYREPVLIACTDGVGTKLKVAQRVGCHDSVGIDLVAMCVNDAICCGAEPLFFLDYVAMPEDDPQVLEQIVGGISQGCLAADCALLGGETAIMPDLYRAGEYDLAGFCVGVVEKDRLIDGASISTGDVVIGIGSTGLHSNGYSLARKIAFEIGDFEAGDEVPELAGRLADKLLTPTAIYVRAVRRILNHYKVKSVVHGIAHITGGGLAENIERILPPGLTAQIDCQAWERPPIFSWLQSLGNVDRDEMYRVFNMGIGLTLIVSDYYAARIERDLIDAGEPAMIIGKVEAGSAAESRVVLKNR